MSDVVARLARTGDDTGALVLRVALGLVMLPHGAQKLLGWFGGYGWSGTVGFFESLGIPSLVGATVILVEFFGALALIVGALGRLAALGMAAIMVGAIALVHRPFGFFMNWFGAQQGEGFEFHLLVITMAVVVMLVGSGRLSVDRWLTTRAGRPLG